MLGGMLRILVVGLLVLVVALMLIGRQGRINAPPQLATVLPEPRELPQVTLTDARGEQFSTSDFAGNYSLLFFGFTNCPDICPLSLQILALVKDSLEKRAPALVPQIAFVSVDPGRDSPSVIRDYLDAFDPEFIGLTAPDEDLAPLLEMLSVTVHRQDVDGETYNMVHNGTIYVLDADGHWTALFGSAEQDVEAIAGDIVRLRRLQPTSTATQASTPDG